MQLIGDASQVVVDKIYLYLKIHNVTGLKYLGKTKKNPYEYSGSGVYWKNHLKKHGNDVSTEILFIANTNDEIKEMGLFYSKLWNIVESIEFANLIEENGIGGVTSSSWKPGNISINKGKKMPILSDMKRAYWEEWHKYNTKKESVYIKKGYNSNSKKNVVEMNKAQVSCPHCEKEGQFANMKRWHFDNCKKLNYG
jgi:hypothetical protein